MDELLDDVDEKLKMVVNSGLDRPIYRAPANINYSSGSNNAPDEEAEDNEPVELKKLKIMNLYLLKKKQKIMNLYLLKKQKIMNLYLLLKKQKMMMNLLLKKLKIMNLYLLLLITLLSSKVF